jgi:hypothetical protein
MTCPAHVAKHAPPLVVDGAVHFQGEPGLFLTIVSHAVAAHHVGWIVSGSFALVSVVASLWLIQKHVKWYSCVRALYLFHLPH